MANYMHPLAHSAVNFSHQATLFRFHIQFFVLSSKLARYICEEGFGAVASRETLCFTHGNQFVEMSVQWKVQLGFALSGGMGLRCLHP